MSSVRTEEEAKDLRSKLTNYLDNLKTVEASLALEPTHEDLLSIKSNLLEIVKILTFRLLEFEKFVAQNETEIQGQSEKTSPPKDNDKTGTTANTCGSSPMNSVDHDKVVVKVEPGSNPTASVTSNGNSLELDGIGFSSCSAVTTNPRATNDMKKTAFLPRSVQLKRKRPHSNPDIQLGNGDQLDRNNENGNDISSPPASPQSNTSSSSAASRLTPPPADEDPPSAFTHENDISSAPSQSFPINRINEGKLGPFDLDIRYVRNHLMYNTQFAEYVHYLHEKIDLVNLSLLPYGIASLVRHLIELDPSMLTRAKMHMESGAICNYNYKEAKKILGLARKKMRNKQINNLRIAEGLPPIPFSRSSKKQRVSWE